MLVGVANGKVLFFAVLNLISDRIKKYIFKDNFLQFYTFCHSIKTRYKPPINDLKSFEFELLTVYFLFW